MRLLLTRAADDSARTKARLEALGYSVLVSPVIEIVPVGTGWPRRVPTGVIATSAHAFCGGCDNEPSKETKETVPLFLVGRRTEEAARRKGFMGPATIVADSDELAPILLAQKKTRFVYIVGRDRKGVIEEKLLDAGHRLCVLETYAAEAAQALTPEAAAALAGGAIDAVLHYSRRSAEIFGALAAAAAVDPARSRHVCISPDVACALIEMSCSNICVAAAPEEQAMFALLDEC